MNGRLVIELDADAYEALAADDGPMDVGLAEVEVRQADGLLSFSREPLIAAWVARPADGNDKPTIRVWTRREERP